jgi:hypothetical protein
MNVMANKLNPVGKLLIDANFYLSALILLYGGFTAITETQNLFDFNEDLYGAIHNNLRIALLYLAMTEVVVLIYSWVTKQPRMILFVGVFLIMMLGSLAFYSNVNVVPIDKNLEVFFLYTGISHGLFGWLSDWHGLSRPQKK